MSMWNLEFISERDFKHHVRETIGVYKKALQLAETLGSFNKNIVDPVKFTFDKYLYGLSWRQIISKEIIRQKDKTVNNSIGYFHQQIFRYIHKDGCRIVVPDNGVAVFSEHGGEAGWDIALEKEDDEDRFYIDANTSVKRIYVEMKNKHNTMNAASASKTRLKMEHQITRDDDSACFLVEAIARTSQNVNWEIGSASNRRIRRVSMDEFYGIVTNDSLGFYKVCCALLKTIQEIVDAEGRIDETRNQDSVFEELSAMANDVEDEELQKTIALYMLGFGSYRGFGNRSFRDRFYNDLELDDDSH